MKRVVAAGSRSLASGWIASVLSTILAALWAFWGSIEAFHEGWFARNWTSNLLGAAAYLIPMALIMVPAIISISGWIRLGCLLHIAVAASAAWVFELYRRPAMLLILSFPLCLCAILYLFARFTPVIRKWGLRMVTAIPLLTALVSGAWPAYLAVTREDDGDYGTRIIEGNDGLRLAWAPQGPGWPADPASWIEAQQTCDHLAVDGLTVQADPVRIWRLPTVDEAVRSGVRHGRNAGGIWDPVTLKATYRIQPNKETPLWTRYSQAMYRWTSTETSNNPQRAYRYVWNGIANSYPKNLRIHFRCVTLPRN
jgi:hypothetical protein